ncbi:conserved hypothetical protein [Pediculus humanus corporis]|uniref:Bromo domain-containing protein n=1 Tax=Pediculus humanus subsp. corporis TaxID=121224 RepID=E0VZS7_PEDHC|nr:uncharacterized protein Phum_PHUM537650 [Pediculus humanus corporis]EEB18883.1 conserved hypothetical protein [Pediculus humanus corporis]
MGLDPLTILQERENRFKTSSFEIELRSLRLLNFQRQLKSEVTCTRRYTTLETAVNVKAYKRTKHQGLREARATEKLEKQQKLEAERKPWKEILSEPFMKLPSKNKLPDYYDIINKPLDIKKIFNRIEDGKYSDFDDLEKDFTQMCKNAQIYNEEASLIHEDLIVLQSVFTNARQRLEQDAETDEKIKDGNSESESVRMKIKIKSGKGGRGGEGRGSTRRRKTQPKYTNSDDEDEDD